MKNIFKLLLLTSGVLFMYSSCKKVDDLPFYTNGTAGVLSSSSPTIAASAADATKDVVVFNWTNPKYANDSASTKYIVQIDSTGRNFANGFSKTVNGALTTSLTGRELNAILLNFGFKLGVASSVDVRMISSYKNNNERYTTNIVKLSVTPFADPAILTSGNAAVKCALATATSLSNTFSWTGAFIGYPGGVTYTLQYDSAGKNFVAPIDIAFGATVLTKAFTQGEMNETALTSGIAGGITGKVEYRIKAVTASGAIAYSNVSTVTIESYIPILRLYLPGGYQAGTDNGNNWDPSTAPELIRDLRSDVFNQLYYTYIYLPAGAEFKVTVGRSWDENYGGSGGNLSGSGGNLTVAAAGYYRISVNRKTMKYDIREGRMGFVGGGTGAGWSPPSVFPNYAMGNAGTNLFVGLTSLTVDGWKLIDNDQWNNGSNAVDETRSYGTSANSGGSLQTNGDNFSNVATAGRYRAIWDGRNRDNVKYELSPATEMRLVGDGMTAYPDWSPSGSPQMTYVGNGVWTITVGLKADKSIKFLAGNDWGAFDYEDNSGGSNAVGTARKIKWEGGDNFKTPASAGTYTITLNENLQTVTITN
jgi:hypothetical protein